MDFDRSYVHHIAEAIAQSLAHSLVSELKIGIGTNQIPNFQSNSTKTSDGCAECQCAQRLSQSLETMSGMILNYPCHCALVRIR